MRGNRVAAAGGGATGKRDGDAVAQLYLSFPNAPGMPARVLRGVSHVALKAGESRAVHFDVSPRDLSSVTADGDRVVAPGAYRLSIGQGQPLPGVTVVKGVFRVEGSAALPP